MNKLEEKLDRMQNTATSFLSRWYENHAFQIKWSPDCKILKCNEGDNTDGSNNYSHTEICMLIQSFDIKSLVKNNQDTVWSWA